MDRDFEWDKNHPLHVKWFGSYMETQEDRLMILCGHQISETDMTETCDLKTLLCVPNILGCIWFLFSDNKRYKTQGCDCCPCCPCWLCCFKCCNAECIGGCYKDCCTDLCDCIFDCCCCGEIYYIETIASNIIK